MGLRQARIDKKKGSFRTLGFELSPFATCASSKDESSTESCDKDDWGMTDVGTWGAESGIRETNCQRMPESKPNQLSNSHI